MRNCLGMPSGHLGQTDHLGHTVEIAIISKGFFHAALRALI